MDPCCNQVVGGKVYVSADDQRWEASGDVTIEPSNVSRELGATPSGRLTVVETAKPFRATLDMFNFCKNDPLELFKRRCGLNFTVVEKSRGFMHLFTNASVGGTPSINLQSGVISGIEIASDQYSRIEMN